MYHLRTLWNVIFLIIFFLWNRQMTPKLNWMTFVTLKYLSFLARFFLAQLPHERSHRIVNKAITFCIIFFLFQNISFRANDTFASSVLLSFYIVLLILLQLSRVSVFYFMQKKCSFLVDKCNELRYDDGLEIKDHFMEYTRQFNEWNDKLHPVMLFTWLKYFCIKIAICLLG